MKKTQKELYDELTDFYLNNKDTLHETGIDVVKNLMAQGLNPNFQETNGKNSPIYWAAYHRDVKSLRHMIEHGGDVNVQNDTGDIPLYPAILFIDGFETVDVLLAAGADMDLRNDKGENAFDHARGCRCLETRTIFLDKFYAEQKRRAKETAKVEFAKRAKTLKSVTKSQRATPVKHFSGFKKKV